MSRKSTFDQKMPGALIEQGFQSNPADENHVIESPHGLRCSKATGRAPDMIATMLLETLDTARDLGRLNEIAGVLLRHGFGDAVRRLGLADRLQRAGHGYTLGANLEEMAATAGSTLAAAAAASVLAQVSNRCGWCLRKASSAFLAWRSGTECVITVWMSSFRPD